MSVDTLYKKVPSLRDCGTFSTLSSVPSLKGVVHEGETTGTFENIGGIKTYVATPSKEYPKDMALLFLPDALGVDLNNNKLLADAFAANGFKVYMPDVYSGDAIPESAFDQPGSFDVPGWLSRHPASLIEPIIEKVMGTFAESEGVKVWAATGYCLGARYVFNLAFENKIVCSVVAHPTALQIEDLEKYAQVSRAPLLINTCTIDPQFPPEKIEAADRILGAESFKPVYERVHWEGCTHGYAVRGDPKDPKVQAAKEGTFKKSVEFLKEHF